MKAFKAKLQKDRKSDPYVRGPEQIRTAVEAFAELCLATRPQDHFLTSANITDFFIRNCKYYNRNSVFKFFV